MILIWRGWGLLAIVSLFPLLASCGGLISVEPIWICMLAVFASLYFAGTVCVHYGTRWNRDGNWHSFYFIPLQAWGWAYLAFLGLLGAVGVGGGIFRLLKPLPGPSDPQRPHPAYVSLVGGLILVVVAGTAWVLVRLARTRRAGGMNPEFDNGLSIRSWDVKPTDRPGHGLTKFIAAIGLSAFGTITSLALAWWAAHQWDSFSDHYLFGTWVFPLLLYFLAFWLVARRTGEWPVERRTVRFINSGILAAQCAVLGYLSFVLVSFTWNEHALPPEKASITHLVLHPSDIPALKETQEKWGDRPARESIVSWHKGVILGFFVGAFCGYVYSMGKGNTL